MSPTLDRLQGRNARLAAVCAILIAAAPGLAESRVGAREGQRLVDTAKTALLSGDDRAANELTATALQQKNLPRKLRVEALLTSCAATFNEGRVDEAFAQCDLAEEVGGRSWRIDGLRGMANLVRGNAEAAVAAFRAALRQNGSSRVLRRGLRKALLALYPDG